MVAGPDGGATSAPAACSSAEGRIDVVVRGPDLGYYYTWAVSSELYLVADTPPLSWAPWQALGGTFTSKPAVASYGDGAIDVVGRALDGSVLRSHCASGGAFGPWTTIDDGPAFSAPAACCTAPGELDVFWSARVLPYFESPLAHPLVTPGDIPVYRDYDGDGRPDFGAWRPSTGEWLVIYSSDDSEHTQQWGTAGDIPVPGDYDGDGKTDYAVWRPSTGEWWIIHSSDGSQVLGTWGIPAGLGQEFLPSVLDSPGDPAAAALEGDTLYVFGRDPSGALEWAWKRRGPDPLSMWNLAGGTITGSPAACVDGADVLVVAKSADGTLVSIRIGPGGEGNWASLGPEVITGDPGVVTTIVRRPGPGGLIEVGTTTFVLARDEANTVRIALAFSALYPATTWLPIPALPQPAPLPASLHLVVLTDDGSVMATCRDPQGGWLGWTDVLAQIGGPDSGWGVTYEGPPLSDPTPTVLTSVAAATVTAGALVMVGAYGDPALHVARWTPDYRWSRWETYNPPATGITYASGLLWAAGDGNRCHLLILDGATILTATRDTDDQWSGEEIISAVVPPQQVVAPLTGLNDIPGSVIISGGFNGLAAATVSGELHLAARVSLDTIYYPPASSPPSTTELPLWHAVQQDDGTWSTWEPVSGLGLVPISQDSAGSPFAPASGHTDDTLQFAVVAGIGTALHIVIAQQRNSFHATLDATGAVSAWGYLGGLPQTATAMAVTAVDGDCHVVTARDDGSLWHTIVGADGSVLPWEDVWAQAGSLPGRIVSLATAGFPFVHAATPALAAGSTPQYPLPVSDASPRP